MWYYLRCDITRSPSWHPTGRRRRNKNWSRKQSETSWYRKIKVSTWDIIYRYSRFKNSQRNAYNLHHRVYRETSLGCRITDKAQRSSSFTVNHMTDYIANGIGRNLLICHVIRVTLGLYEIHITESASISGQNQNRIMWWLLHCFACWWCASSSVTCV